MLFLSCGSRKWVGGEVLKALAYDVPIPGYKTKNAISLRLWEAKATAEDFNLFQFNDGQYESAAQLHARAQQVIFHSKLNTINFNTISNTKSRLVILINGMLVLIDGVAC